MVARVEELCSEGAGLQGLRWWEEEEAKLAREGVEGAQREVAEVVDLQWKEEIKEYREPE